MPADPVRVPFVVPAHPSEIGGGDPATAMSADGFHPGPPVYAAWAEVIAEALDEAREAVGAG